ncbi:hypothetical protein AVEN_130973-1 [Araneus ventricosus]|uniref:Uncharacterized protein n=1 Tax=Araneus ventricosus TaxID=182803 RepID=A0A4Y2Q1C0_ARAVE|nr:hypothetical protein AVEN_130973-1 [Araneus ventricosus]
MSIFAGERKCDLKILAEELGETANDSHKLKDLKKMILASRENEEIQIAERRRQDEIAERRRQDEIQIAEQKRQDKVAERRRQDEIQIAEQKRQEEIELRKLEYEERKRKDEMEFELQKYALEQKIKRKVSQEIKDHFIDEWSKLNSPDDLVEKLDDYDTLRSTLKSKRPHKEWHYDKQNSLKDDSALEPTEIKKNCTISVAQKLKLKFERAANKIYGFGNQKMPALTPIGRIKAVIEVDNVKAENISIYVVPDDAQTVDLIIGRTWLDLPHIAYTKIGKRVHIGYREDELFRNFPIDEKVNPVCFERLETAQSESKSLQIKDTSQQKMMGNLADDLKMEKNKNVDNLKSNNDSLVKTNSYYDKNKSSKVLLGNGDIVAVRRKPNKTSESTKPQPRYQGPMVVTQVRSSDKYRISQLEPRNGRPYATIVQISQLKVWRSWNEDDDNSSTSYHNEPEMQRSKRTVRTPLRYGDFMPNR